MIYLIGGAPRVGKSIVAKRLAEQLGSVIISTDILEDEMVKTMSEEERRTKFPLPGFDADPEKNVFSPQKRCALLMLSAETLAPMLEQKIEAAVERGETTIFEGVDITPSLVDSVLQRLGKDKIRYAFIWSCDSALIVEGIQKNSSEENWLKDSNPEVVRQVADFAAAVSLSLEEECRDYGLEYLERTADFEVDMEKIVATLQS